MLSIRDEVEINSKQNILILEKFERFKEEVKSVQEEQNENLRNVNLQYPKILEGVISVHQANLKNAEEINHNIEEGVKLTSNHSEIILNEIKVIKDEVFSLEEKNRKQKQSSLIMGQLETLEDEVKSVKEEQNANHSKMNLQYSNIVEEVKKAGNINLNLEQCVEKYSKNSNMINEHLKSLKEEVKSVHKDMKIVEEINLNVEEGVKLAKNHSEIILKQIRVFKDEVFSLEEENMKR